jgi:hypothetical protein
MTVSPTLDYYLVMTGPWLSSALGRNTSLWVIDYVYLFDAQQLLAEKQRHGVKIGFATSVQKEDWKAARYTPHNSADCCLSVRSRGTPSAIRIKNEKRTVTLPGPDALPEGGPVRAAVARV